MSSPRRTQIGPERAPWLREGPLPRLLDVLDRDGEEARVVGGAVRNALARRAGRRHRRRHHGACRTR